MKFSVIALIVGLSISFHSCNSDNQSSVAEQVESSAKPILTERVSEHRQPKEERLEQLDTSSNAEKKEELEQRKVSLEKNKEIVFSPSVEEPEVKQSQPVAQKKKNPAKGKIYFPQDTYDFGFIDMGEEVDHSFNFRNIGKSDINISNTKASCGCTTPSYPFIPIEPGQAGKIDVHFSSKGRLGSQQAEITVYNDGDDPVVKLFLKGVVRAPLADETIDSIGSN